MSSNSYTICPKEKCTGCGLCAHICRHNAISIKIDKYGFRYPEVNNDLCIKCGLCKKKCPSLSQQTSKYPTKAYACYNTNDNERKKSSSGGIGYLLAQCVTKSKGVVYGCAFTPPWGIQHIRCTSINEIERLRGSKYVQSDISNIYDSIQKDLKASKKVLFIGTPCQVAGIKAAFPENESLYLIDIICHGVSSLQFLKETLPHIKIPIANIKFREGTFFRFSLETSSGTEILSRNLSNDMYMKGFFNGTTFRPNCYICPYAKQQRISDITIGDFWGIKSTTIKNIKDGISLSLINTLKGEMLFNQCKDQMFTEIRPLNEAFAGNEQLNNPFKKTFRTSIFRYLYPKIGYNKALWCALPDKVLAMHLKHLLKK